MTSPAIHVATNDELLAAIGAPVAGAAAIILIGGADGMGSDQVALLRGTLDTIARHAASTETAIVDGGTDSGVMRLIAEARLAIGGSFPLIGVVPVGAVTRTTGTGAPITPARNHSLVVLVPGSRFGDETAWLFAAADHLAFGSAPSIVINGGRLALAEAHARIDGGHLVIAVEGSGRAADELVADPALRASGRLRVIPLDVDAAGLAAALGAHDGGGSTDERGMDR